MQIEFIKIKPTRTPKAGYTVYPMTIINYAEKPGLFFRVFGEMIIDLNRVIISPASFQVCWWPLITLSCGDMFRVNRTYELLPHSPKSQEWIVIPIASQHGVSSSLSHSARTRKAASCTKKAPAREAFIRPVWRTAASRCWGNNGRAPSLPRDLTRSWSTASRTRWKWWCRRTYLTVASRWTPDTCA